MCSRCNSFEDASMLLEELRLFDNQVYGVAHGLLMGYRDNIWVQALSLFDEVKLMDSSTASAFYNALTDMLWHFGQVSLYYSCQVHVQLKLSWVSNDFLLFHRNEEPSWSC